MTHAVLRSYLSAAWLHRGIKKGPLNLTVLGLLLAVAAGAPVSAQAEEKQAAKPAASGEKSVSWLKLCEKQPAKLPKEGEKPQEVQVCSTQMDMMDKLGTYMFGVRVLNAEGQKEDILQVVLPHVPIQIMARSKDDKKDAKPKVVGHRPSNFVITAGVRLQIDDAKDPKDLIGLQYSSCNAEACIATAKVTPELNTKLRKGTTLRALAIDAAGITIPYPPAGLKDFAAVYDGKPLDPEVYKAQLKEFSKVIQANRQVLAEKQKEAYEKRKAEEMKNLPPPPGAPAAKK